MGIKKKRYHDKVVFTFSIDIMADIERNVSENKDEALDVINQIIHSSDGKQQMALFKEVESVLIRNQNGCVSQKMAINVLGQMYFQINCRSSLKRAVSSVLQALSINHPELVLVSLTDPLMTVVSVPTEVTGSNIKDCMDQILSLFDNFPVGKLAIDKNYINVLECVNYSLKTLLQNLSGEGSPQQINDYYSICQTTLKVLNLMLQQHNVEANHVTDHRCQLKPILTSVVKLLDDNRTLLNCRINAGISFSLLLRDVDNIGGYMSYLKHRDNDIRDDTVPQSIRKFPAVSQVCIWSGVMAVLSIEELISAEIECSLFSQILREIIVLSERKEDTVIISSCARAILQWLDVTSQMFDSEVCSQCLKQQFSEDSETIQVLLQYVWTNWEHFMDCVQYHTRDIFRKIIVLYIQSRDIDPKSSSFLRQLCRSLLEMPWHRRGKYSILCCLAEHLGSTVFIQLLPSLPDDLYSALSDGSLASHVSELFDALFKSASTECDKSTWENIWLKPLINTMCNASKPQKYGLTEHVLPKLFSAYPESINFLVSELSSLLEVQSGNCFSALVACGKVAQKCGVYKTSKECSELCSGFIPKKVLESALCHAEDQVRLSAFSLICDSPKTTECLTTSEFDLIKTSLPLNINIQCPAFRQQFVSFIKKFLLQIRESSYAFLKKVKQSKNDEVYMQSILEEYRDFLLWLKNFLFSCLHPSANFPRRVTALSLLSLYCDIFSNTEKQFGLLVDDESSAQTLVETLKDTYENNKQKALEILTTVQPVLLNFGNKQRAENTLDAALLLATSNKPPDSITAAFILALMTQHDIRNVIYEKISAVGESDIISFSDFKFLDVGDDKDVPLSVTCLLVIHLTMHLETAKKSILQASVKCPLYGVLICIRKILSGVNFASISSKHLVKRWKLIFSKLISLCFEVVAVVEPIVCNSSPEGHLPMDTDPESISQLQTAVQNAISGRYRNAVVNADDDASSVSSIDLVKTKAVTAQMLLLCCWRAHKDVSLLLGCVVENVPISDPNGEEGAGMLSTLQVTKIGHFYIEQLCVLKHRGCFEQAYVGFCKLCHRLWRSSIRDLSKLPQEWLQQLFSVIRGEEESIRLCPTRRSAGLPFIFQALLVSELDVTGSVCFKQAMATLLDLSQPDLTKDNTECQVHAINVLRALYKDSYLGENVMSYASEGLKVSIRGFHSASWAMRNAATLLFSALMTRIFGVNRSRDEVQRKNCMTGRVFFFRFPDLFEFLLDELKFCVAALKMNGSDNTTPLQPSLYPVLLLLGRLYPSTIEGIDSNLKLTVFVPYLRQCTDSAIWKTRILAAKALVPLLSCDEYVTILEELFASLSSPSCDSNQNQIHGVLLQILYILKEVPQLPDSQQAEIKEQLPLWISSHLSLSGSNNPCYITRASFMEIVYFSILENLAPASQANAEIIFRDLLVEITSSNCPPGKSQFVVASAYVSFLHLVLRKFARVEALFTTEDVSAVYPVFERFILALTTSPLYEARLVTLQFILWVCDNSMGYANLSEDFVMLKTINWNMPVILEEKIKLQTLIAESQIISAVVVHLLISETHPECLARVYYLMFLMYDAQNVNWISLPIQTSVTYSQKLKWVLECMDKCKNADVKNAMLLFSSSVAKWSYDTLFQDGSFVSVFTLMQWMKEVERSSLSDQNLSRRRTAVLVLKHISETILLDRRGILDCIICIIWQAFMQLLLDDEPEIKRQAGDIVISIRKVVNNDLSACALPVVPARAIDLMIGQFVEKFSRSIPSECLTMLVRWMLRSEGEQTEMQGDEQPFDKGEMNVFAEDFALAALAKKHLLDFLKINNKQVLNFRLSLIPCWYSRVGVDIEDYLCIDRCMKLCLDETVELVNKFSSLNDHSPFLNHCFDQNFLRISQCVQVISTLIAMCDPNVQRELCFCLENILKKLKTLKYVNIFIDGIMNCIKSILNNVH